MTTGIALYNQNDIEQIDENFRCLLRVATGTVTGSNVGGDASATFPAQTTVAPLVFVQPHADGTYIGGVSISADSFSAMHVGDFDYIVFGLDSAEQVDLGTFGLQVFNASSQLIYDSRFEQPRVQQIPVQSMPWPDYIASGGSGAQPAYPYTLGFSGWGTRPWFCLNALFYDSSSGSVICGTTSGTDAIVLRNGYVSAGAWVWMGNDGTGGGYARSYPGGQLRLPLLRRDF